jgi:ferredoxin
MSIQDPLTGLIIDKLCVNCHACISVCPVKFCDEAAGNTIRLNSERTVPPPSGQIFARAR